MEVCFHTDPVCIKIICTALLHHGVVVIATTRPNFRAITDRVESEGITVLPLVAKGADGDFFNFLFRADLSYECGKTEISVMYVIQKWQQAGQPYPFVHGA